MSEKKDRLLKSTTDKDSLPPAARRALEEAEARRAALAGREAELEAARQGEEGGPRGKEPTRYGDWERKGIAYDF